MRPKCPKCGSEDFEEFRDEVDIGVGTQTFLRGGECRTCGEMAVCGSCSAWDFMPHRSWCDKMEEGQ